MSKKAKKNGGKDKALKTIVLITAAIHLIEAIAGLIRKLLE
jgi:hypothetical protein